MVKIRKKNDIWVVVEVKSGIPVSAQAFSKFRIAKTKKDDLKKNINEESDEVSIFKINIES